MGEVALLRNLNKSNVTSFITEYEGDNWKAVRAINLSRDSPPLAKFNRVLNGDSTGPSGALIQATQSPLGHGSCGSALRALMQSTALVHQTSNITARDKNLQKLAYLCR